MVEGMTMELAVVVRVMAVTEVEDEWLLSYLVWFLLVSLLLASIVVVVGPQIVMDLDV